jgi:hypothetical protein
VSIEHDEEAGEATEYDRWNVEIPKDRVDKANLLNFGPDDIWTGLTKKWGVAKIHIPR